MLNKRFSNLIDCIRLLFRKDKESYSCFYKMLGFYPHNISYYKQALLHKSSSVKSDKGRLINNERLEFLGDAILDAIIADILYQKFDGKREGFLTNTRSKVVSRETLNSLADQIGLSSLIKFSTRQSAHNSYMGGNAFEALIGAIYLDRGYAYCKYFMESRIIGTYLNLDKISRKEVNFKSKLIEWSQKNKIQIAFELIRQSQDEFNSPTFESEVLLEGIQAGKGMGYSKKESQQIAAHEALNKLKKNSSFMEKVLAEKALREEGGEIGKVQEETESPKEKQADFSVEVVRRTIEAERIISEAEEAAFREAEA